MRHIYYLGILLFAGMIQVKGQDKIYYKKNKTDEWKVSAVTAGYIKGMDSRNAGISYSTTNRDVLFLFNDKGNFLVIPRLFTKHSAADVYISNFLQKVNNAYSKADIIITAEYNIIGCSVVSENDAFVEYKMANELKQVPKNKLVVIIYKNGTHKLFITADKASRVLLAIQDKYNEVAFAPARVASAEAPAVATTTVVGGQSDTAKPAANNPGVSTFTVANSDKTAALKIEQNLDKETYVKLQDMALQNIKELASFIMLLSNKKTGPDESARIIDQAVSLFVNEDAQFEVSSLNRTAVQQFKVRTYLKRLGLLKYSKVNIEWYSVLYTSRLRKGADGNYYGIIAFEQRFTGMSRDNKKYEDRTRKTVEVILKPYAKNRDGESRFEWGVFLGNIGISATKAS